MSRFKAGDRVQFEGKGVIYQGIIQSIIKGTYNKETNQYTTDTYYVETKRKTDDSLVSISCSKHDLIKIKNDEVSDSFSLNKEVIFYCKNHQVVVVGVRDETKEEITTVVPSSKKMNGRTHQGTFTTTHQRLLKTFTMGYAICHSDDEFDENEGVTIALKRAYNSPLGKLETNNWSMLQDGQCNELVSHEAEYISENIEKFIHKKKTY